MDVPWTIYTKDVDTGFEVGTHGISHGVQYYHVNAEYFLESQNSPNQEMPIRVLIRKLPVSVLISKRMKSIRLLRLPKLAQRPLDLGKKGFVK